MPIDIDKFEETSKDELACPNHEVVMRFLARNADKAFKPAEIAEETGIKKSSIHTVLSRLKERKVVRHKGPYYAITDKDDRLAAYEGALHAPSLDDRLGKEDPEEWGVDTTES